MDKSQEAAKRRLLKALDVTGWSSTRLAKEAGVVPSTMNRFLHQDVAHTPSLRTMSKVDEAVARFLDGLPDKDDAARKRTSYFGTTASALERIEGMITLEVRGAVQAGLWAEAVEWPPDEWQTITLPRPDAHRNHFGLKVRGPSMNLVYPEGTFLVCVPYLDYGGTLQDGDHVIVERWQGDSVEATVKELRQAQDGTIWLWPRSDHPEHQSPIALPRNGDDHPEYDGSSEIRITAIVVADYRIRARR